MEQSFFLLNYQLTAKLMSREWLPLKGKTSTMKLSYEQEQYVRKFLVICATQLAVGVLIKKLKCFEVKLNIFELS